MQITVKSTKEIVHINGAPARAWVGSTSEGAPIVAYITCIQVEAGVECAELDRELTEKSIPAPAQAEQLHEQAKKETAAANA